MSDKHSTLTQSRLRELLRYDPATGLFSWWKVAPGRWKPIAGCINKAGYCLIRIDYVAHYAHRLAWLYIRGEWPDGEIDHKDGNPSNNSLENLRCVSHAENMQNARCGKRQDKQITLPGAYRDQKTGKWRAAISIDGRYTHLGQFATEKEAHDAYMRARRELHPGQLIDFRTQAPA